LAMPALANAEGTDAEPVAEEYLSDNLLPNGDFTQGLDFWSDVSDSSEINATLVTDDSNAPVAGKPYVDIEIVSGYPSYNNSRAGYFPAGK